MYQQISSTDATYYYNYGYWETITCPACNGLRVQRRYDGINIICPACQGKGQITIYKENNYPSYPTYPPQPWITYEYKVTC